LISIIDNIIEPQVNNKNDKNKKLKRELLSEKLSAIIYDA
jgi:hypothetical protein